MAIGAVGVGYARVGWFEWEYICGDFRNKYNWLHIVFKKEIIYNQFRMQGYISGQTKTD
jgi:hypothetical protein